MTDKPDAEKMIEEWVRAHEIEILYGVVNQDASGNLHVDVEGTARLLCRFANQCYERAESVCNLCEGVHSAYDQVREECAGRIRALRYEVSSEPTGEDQYKEKE